MKWCYSPLRHEDGTCDKICTYNTIHVQTNGDRIRSMSDEELADFLYKYLDCTDCPIECDPGKDICLYKIMGWLKKESE